jgi:hypothetical protein
VDDLFDLAAEVAVRIRIDIDKQNPGWKLRLTIGGAKEFLWQADKIEDRNAFVKGILKFFTVCNNIFLTTNQHSSLRSSRIKRGMLKDSMLALWTNIWNGSKVTLRKTMIFTASISDSSMRSSLFSTTTHRG